MTFQVALVGEDGLVVGSDRKILYVRNEVPSSVKDVQVNSGPKHTENDEVVCFYAGGSQGFDIAQEIVNHASPERSSSERCENLRRITDDFRSPARGEEILVVRKAQGDLVLINRTDEGARTSPVHEHRCTGVATRSAILVQQFWKRLPVERLRRLALIVMEYAARERPQEVGNGFDLLTVARDGSPEWEFFTPNDSRVIRIVDEFERATF